MNTGFGGSANTRTRAVEELQRILTRFLNYGMLVGPEDRFHSKSLLSTKGDMEIFSRALPLDDPMAATCMPESWVRGAMLVRLNSLASGASGVEISTIEALRKLIEHDITPRIPIRGSISASGDLSPLSYVAGVMQGKPTLTAWVGSRESGQRRIVRADAALAEAELLPIKLGAKEGLALVNGTAISTAVAALAMHEAHCQATLSQVLVAMTVEGLSGTDESFDPFFAEVRPHPGQQDSAQNIQAFLRGSKLVYRSDGSEEAFLRQDRYSIRTASQWIGPVLEDLLLAHQQVVTESNSVTDNPLVDIERNALLHGGNFQAKSITSAMEKVRQGCQTIGRMLSVQCTELINPATNRGLPPNLVVDEPSESYLWKGTDIMVAALQSELGFLANPVGSHVQTAEMGNQALNSLALISARYTLDALDVLSQLSAVHLIALCQALDLRAMNIHFLEIFEPSFREETQKAFRDLNGSDKWLDECQSSLWMTFRRCLDQTTTLDSAHRFSSILDSLQPVVLKFAPSLTETLVALEKWTSICSTMALNNFNLNREQYIAQPDATKFLGLASRRMYRFVREQLHVPFLQEKTIRTPEPESFGAELKGGPNGCAEHVAAPNVSSLMTTVYLSMRNGELYGPVMECLEETKHVYSDHCLGINGVAMK